MPSACPRLNIVALVGVRLVVPSLFVVAFVLSPWVAQADIITVAVGCSLPQAIRAANTDLAVSSCAPGNGDDIIVLTAPVNPVTYNASFDADGPNATPSITTTIVISGGVAGAIVQRTGAVDARLFHVAATGKLTLERVTVKNGRLASDFGGAIYNLGTLTLLESVLLSNTAQAGGGFFNLSTATLTNTQILSNTASGEGGGFYNYGTATLTGSDILSNMAQVNGGGFFNLYTATLTNTQIISNTADNGGGFSNLGTATLTDSGIGANQATNEGGGVANSGTASLTGGELLANTAAKGAGIYNIGTATLSQVRILQNEAANSGGALYQDFFGATTIEQSCIVHNSDTAVFHNSGPTIDAEDNWWGAPDGPSGAGLGAGDSVSSGVDFTPFHPTALLGCPLRQAEIAFAKRVSPAGTLMPGQPLTYTLTLTNTGTLTVHNLHVSDALPPLGFVLDSLSAAGAPFRMSGNTTIFTTTAPGQVLTVTLSGHVDATLNADLLLTNMGILTSPVLGTLSDSVDANVVVPSLSWSSAAYQSEEGSGPFNATVLLVPPNPYVTVTVQAVITDSAAALAVAAVQDLTFPPGSDSQTLAIADADDQQILTRTVQLGLAAPAGASLGNLKNATIIFADNDVAELTVAMSANVAQASVGDTITYTIRITNTGDVTFTTVTAGADRLDVATSLAGALAPNASRSAIIPYEVQPGDVGALDTTVTVTGTDALGATVVEEDSVTVTVTPKPKTFLPSLKRE